MDPNEPHTFSFYKVVMLNSGKSGILENGKIRIAKIEVK